MRDSTAPGQAHRGFQALVTPEQWASLLHRGSQRVYRSGERILDQGDTGDWLSVLVAGRVKVLYAEPCGPELLIAVAGPGDVVGEFAARDGGPRSATVEALGTCRTRTVSAARFDAFIAEHGLERQLDRYIMAKVRRSACRMWTLARHSTAARLACLLVEVLDAAGADAPEPNSIPMSQEEAATCLGLVRSSVTPILARWKRAGLIHLGRARIVVLDPDGLRAVCQVGNGRTGLSSTGQST